LNLTRLLVKARVTDLEEVRHIVLSETERFIGQSQTIQCEIIHRTMLGAQLVDEGISPEDDPHDLPKPSFDFFLAYNRQLILFALMMPQNNSMMSTNQEVENWGQWIQGELMLPQQPMTKVTCLTLTSLWKKMSLHKFFNKVDCPWVSLIWNNHYRNGSLSNKRPRGSFWWRAVLK
jgi:hypothetical protein